MNNSKKKKTCVREVKVDYMTHIENYSDSF